MNPSEQKIATMLGAVFRHWRREQLGWFTTTTAAAILAWLLTLIILDNLAMLPAAVLLIAWAALLLTLTVRSILLLHRLTSGRPSATRLALLYERRADNHDNRLINSVEFLGSRRARRNALAQAAVVENAAALDLRTARLAGDLRASRRLAKAAVALLVVMIAYSSARPLWVGNAIARLFTPFAPVTHLLATVPIVSPGDADLIEGQPFNIKAAIEVTRYSTVPRRVLLEYRVADLTWQEFTMRPRGESEFSYEFSAVRRSFAYRVRAGRSLSPTYHASVQPRPRVEALQLTVTRPAYAGAQTRRLPPNIGDATVLAGSQVGIEITASAPLSAAHVEFSSGRRVAIPIAPADLHRGQVSLAVSNTDAYTIHVADTAGLANINPPQYALTVTPDQVPLAIVTRPGRDLILPGNASLELTIEAQDDIGLTTIELQTRAPDRDWSTDQEWPVEPSGARHFLQRAAIDLGTLGLNVGDTLLYRVVAHDNCRPAPNLGIGRTWAVTIAEPDDSAALLAAQTRRLLEALHRILALQRENRAAVDMDRPTGPVRGRQEQIRDLTAALVAEHAQDLRPREHVIAELVALADGPMLDAVQKLGDYAGDYKQRFKLKPALLELMDHIIARLASLVGQLEQSLASAAQAQRVLEQLQTEQREQALQDIRELLTRLRDFLPEQDKVIEQTEELARKGDDLTSGDIETIERLKGIEDRWAEIFLDSVRDITKLTEQGFADETIANDYKEMVEQIEEASLNLTPDLVELAVPREQSGRELAESLVEEMEMWLPNSPDYIQWVMEEPLDFPEIPMVDLPDQLWDFIGDLIEEQDELNDAAEDVTSAWADSLAEGAGWEVAGGPISNFSAVGKTGNQLPDNNELSGRSGDGRSGRSQGQLVEDIAKGLQGRNTPTRITNDPYEEGVVKELQQLATSGATGGGKARGAGQEGLQGESPPPLLKDMNFMRDWQQRIRQKAERVAGQLKMLRINLPDLERALELMREAEQAGVEGRYAEMFRKQQMVMQRLRRSGELAAREIALTIERAYHLPAEQRRKVLDGLEEPLPEEYQPAVYRYFQQLSELP